MPNVITISGYIDSAVEVKHVGTPSKKVAEFRVNDGSTWISITAWEDLADKVPPQGAHLIVSGRIRTRSYEAKDGTKRYVTECIAAQIEQVGAPAKATTQPDPDPLFAD